MSLSSLLPPDEAVVSYERLAEKLEESKLLSTGERDKLLSGQGC